VISHIKSAAGLISLPVCIAHRALPIRCSYAALVADAVAAATAHGARVPELSERPLAAGAGPLAVLSGKALGALPSKLLQLVLHPPEVRGGTRTC